MLNSGNTIFISHEAKCKIHISGHGKSGFRIEIQHYEINILWISIFSFNDQVI